MHVRRGQAEVLGEVYYPHPCGHTVLAEEGLALAVAEAEEHYVGRIERHGVGEPQLRVAKKAPMHVGHGVARVALAVGKHYLRLRVAQQNPYKLAPGIPGCAQYSNSYHNLYLLGIIQ